MSQLFLTNFSIIIIKHVSKINQEDTIFCLGNQSIISKFHHIKEAKYFLNIANCKA